MNAFAKILSRARCTAMKHEIMVLVFLFFISGCSTLHDNRLHGKFLSDKQATLKYLEETGKYTPEHLDRLGTLLGKMKITYNKDNSAIIESDGTIRQESFKILELSSDHTVIEYDQCGRYKIIFKGNGYWVSGGIMPPPYMEKFVRLEE